MELADQGPLGRHIGPRVPAWLQLSKKQKYAIALGIIQGLKYLHSSHIVHRDLKPDNILLFGSQLIPKIADFGLAKIVEKTMATMRTVAGTPIYQAPETFETDDRGYTSQSDIYSVSLILYELLSGRNPLPCNRLNIGRVLTLKLKEHPPVPSSNIPEPVFVLVSRGYSVDPNKRPMLTEFLFVISPKKPAVAGLTLHELGVKFQKGIKYPC
jgi:serine/threonine protein kinase